VLTKKKVELEGTDEGMLLMALLWIHCVIAMMANNSVILAAAAAAAAAAHYTM